MTPTIWIAIGLCLFMAVIFLALLSNGAEIQHHHDENKDREDL